MRKNYSIIDLQEFAKTKNGKCLSDKYINSHTKYLWEDHLGNRWEAKWYSILNGRWSPFLVKEKQRNFNLKYTINDLHSFAETKGGKCLSIEYVKTKTKYLWLDSKNRKFQMTWEAVLAGQWSPYEKQEKLSKLKTKYTLNDLIEYAKRFNGECLSKEYIKASSIYKWKDENGNIFFKSWFKLKKSNSFYGYNPISNGHNQIIAFLKEELNLNDIKINSRETINDFELDIFIKSKNIAIEYNGTYWHSEANERIYKNYHLDKYNICKNNNIKLIQIFDFEWKNKKDQVKSFLRSALGCNQIKLNARDLNVQEINKQDAKEFLNKYHILGGNNKFLKAFGLIDPNYGLVSVITIGMHHRNNKELVLTRYCGKDNITVRGGLSKLTKAALSQFNSLTTWIDLRMSNGESWIKNGWKLVGVLPPDYFYYHTKKSKIISKQSRRKTVVNTPKNMSEHEHALKDGLVRVYDCGKIKLFIDKNEKIHV